MKRDRVETKQHWHTNADFVGSSVPPPSPSVHQWEEHNLFALVKPFIALPRVSGPGELKLSQKWMEED